jgi:hypothetical protein
MNLKAKSFVENNKRTIQQKLISRSEILKERGLDPTAIGKDVVVRKLRADIRKANYRLACIATAETLVAQKANAKKAKSAAESKKAEPSKTGAKKKTAAETPKKKKSTKE